MPTRTDHDPRPAEPQTGTRPRWPIWLAAAVAGILIVLAFGWLLQQLRGVRDEIVAIRSRQQTLSQETQSLDRRGQELEAELRRRQTATAALQGQLADRAARIAELEKTAARPRRAAPPVVASMVLSAGVRSDDAPTLALPAAADFAELRVDLEGDDGYSSFRATLTTAAAAQLWTATGLEPSASEWGSELVVRLPAKLLGAGVYELALAARARDGSLHTLGHHRFRVVRE